MKLLLYAVDDGDNVINKVLPTPYEVDIRLSNDVDVLTPKIILRDVVGVNYEHYNYAFIDVLGRYYFIDRIAKVNNRDSWLYLSCDVLETYKTEILNSRARVKRNLRTGDYVDVNLDRNVYQSVSLYKSDKGLVDGEKTTILTVLEKHKI